ncbi:hypothetical protein CHLRE_02g097300v5 [Chlamydomonas reinhardtii]|uniref:At4g15545-like C-terminal domain-containing protein n=1 Tax=Chlamydomonas reinhardtii TaxID=3055 RepID=A0A2K3E1Z5_CHLRE|nr:uncharacterized protein CHLRE_02g097300v5 [Chlamydomonas reinhardtii]PNW86830.1 hypothetical protein CHLRE_02g097300v5 [Chlamydomonas reinhardtii]
MATSLPTEVLSVLPVDPFAQLELAARITQHALASKAQQLEQEGQQLRESLVQKQNHIKMLERRVSTLELELQDMAAKSKQAVEEAHRLQSEKSLLAETVKRLHKEVARLDAFKKNLLNHLNSEDEPGLEPSVAAADVAGERLVSEVLSSISKPPPPQMGVGGAYGLRGMATAAATPAFPSTSGRPLYGASTPQAGQPPAASGPPYAAMTGMGMPAQAPPPSTYATPHPHAQYGAAPGSPPRVDGKEFFRQARAQLSYEQFSQFLHQIKELNAGRQTREETLRRAKDIFGMHGAGPEMYMMFEALLSRQSGNML